MRLDLRLEMQQQPPTFLWRAFGFAMRRWYICLAVGIVTIVFGYLLYGLVGSIGGFVVALGPFLYFLGVRIGVLPLLQ